MILSAGDVRKPVSETGWDPVNQDEASELFVEGVFRCHCSL